ncbi:MAG TPA: AlkA N-terminal domain-containing protein [Planctomycetota bacterium]|nr:AlkA N-terminal domain-containing protein [Planctomycetota bacterium]
MQLQGVTTTGIYCRADCTARPRPGNVRPVRNALAALAAGFRPCLLCRPDRLPDLGLDGATLAPPEIAHAVRMIAEGYLDEASTEQLATRIGYSTRHLVRLFEQHIGATPDFVARALRAHLARRLLDESDLSITQVALAAGFSSIRQMNRVMRELFGFAPSVLRAKRSRGVALDALDGGLRLRVPYRGALDARRLIGHLAARATPGVEAVENGSYWRTLNTCGHPGVLQVRDPGCGGHLEAVLHLATFGSIVEQVERVRNLFGLHRDAEGAEKLLRRDALLGPLVRRQPGLRLLGAWDRFETAVRIVVGQQVSVRGASTVTGRLAERFGERVPVALPGRLRFLFPSAGALAKAGTRDLGMPEARARTIVHLAARVASGELDLSRPAPLEQTLATLQAVPGIGPWSAHLIAARVMGEPDAFPASDLGLRKAAATLLGRTEPVAVRELEELAQAWRPHRSTAAAYLWMAEIPAGGAAPGERTLDTKEQ